MLNKILESSKTVPQSAYYRVRNNIDVTYELCLEAVKQNGELLEYVPKHLRTESLCLEAIRQHGCALHSVPEHLRTESLCLEAVKRNGYALQFVPEHLRTEQICLGAVKQHGCALCYIKSDLRVERLCLEAAKQDGHALMYVPGILLMNEEIVLEAAKSTIRQKISKLVGISCEEIIEKLYHSIDKDNVSLV